MEAPETDQEQIVETILEMVKESEKYALTAIENREIEAIHLPQFMASEIISKIGSRWMRYVPYRDRGYYG